MYGSVFTEAPYGGTLKKNYSFGGELMVCNLQPHDMLRITTVLQQKEADVAVINQGPSILQKTSFVPTLFLTVNPFPDQRKIRLADIRTN